MIINSEIVHECLTSIVKIAEKATEGGVIVIGDMEARSSFLIDCALSEASTRPVTVAPLTEHTSNSDLTMLLYDRRSQSIVLRCSDDAFHVAERPDFDLILRLAVSKQMICFNTISQRFSFKFNGTIFISASNKACIPQDIVNRCITVNVR